MVLLFAQVEERSTQEAAGAERAADRGLHPGPAATSVAGVTVTVAAFVTLTGRALTGRALRVRYGKLHLYFITTTTTVLLQ